MKKEEINKYAELLKVVNRSGLYVMLNDYNRYIDKHGENNGYYHMREKVINELQLRKGEL